jgi:hypothetical protein
MDNFSVSSTATFNSSGMVTDATCSNCADGAIDITATGDAPFTFVWSNGATTEDISNLLPGAYSVIVTGNSGCTDSLYFTVNYPVTVDEVNTNWLVNVYPNPTKEEFTLTYNFKSNSEVTLLVSNILGEIVHQDVITNNEGMLKVNASNMNPGVYFIQLTSSTKRQIIKLIIAR